MRPPLLLVLGLMLTACVAEEKPLAEVPRPHDFGYPLDDTLRLNHIQVRGTHNSYHLEPSDPHDEWRYSHVPLDQQFNDQGVRQIELDVHYKSGEKRFAVYHLPNVDDLSTCHWFTECLEVVKAWSDANPGHHPLFIYVEPKDDVDVASPIRGHYDELDAEILSVFPAERLFTPDDLLGDEENLAQAIANKGWPTLGEVRGKVIFVFLDSDRTEKGHHFGYTHGNTHLTGRVQFVDSNVGDPYAAFVGPSVHEPEAIRAAAELGYITRILDDADNIAAGVTWTTATQIAIANGAHIIGTDHPTPKSNPQGYFLDLTGGTPSRCNPVSAPKECTPQAIEEPNKLRD